MFDEKRRSAIREFLLQAGLANAEVTPVAGDFSARRYWRTIGGKNSLIVMDADPTTGEDVAKFARIARFLRSHSLSAPRIYAEDTEAGFLLCEDFGEGLMARVITQDPTLEERLYELAVDLLVALRDLPVDSVPAYDPTTMAQATDLAFVEYMAPITGMSPDPVFRGVRHAFEQVLSKTATTNVLSLRDFHAENLFWLPQRSGIARAGLIDFQDAVATHPAYDLASLLLDARRDVPAALRERMIDRYLTATGLAPEPFREAFTVLGAQRNLRILGICARQARARGRPEILDLVPRVWAHLQGALQSGHLHPVAEALGQVLPEPTPENLQRLAPQ